MFFYHLHTISLVKPAVLFVVLPIIKSLYGLFYAVFYRSNIGPFSTFAATFRPSTIRQIAGIYTLKSIILSSYLIESGRYNRNYEIFNGV